MSQWSWFLLSYAATAHIHVGASEQKKSHAISSISTSLNCPKWSQSASTQSSRLYTDHFTSFINVDIQNYIFLFPSFFSPSMPFQLQFEFCFEALDSFIHQREIQGVRAHIDRKQRHCLQGGNLLREKQLSFARLTHWLPPWRYIKHHYMLNTVKHFSFKAS